MAKKDTNGQLNMFDFFGEDVQMVSLMPDDEFIDDAIGSGFDGGFEEGFEDLGLDDNTNDNFGEDFPMEVSRPQDISEEELPKPKVEASKAETPKAEAPKAESSKVETPKRSTSQKEKDKPVKTEINTYNLTLKDRTKPVMSRCFSLSGNSIDGAVAFLDYNRVYVKELGKSPVSYQFTNSKSAVNFYIDQLNLMGQDGVMKMVEGEVVVAPTEDILVEE